MPNKKSNSSALLALAFAAVMIGVFFLNLTIWLKIAIDVLLILLFLFVRRGYIYFYRGKQYIEGHRAVQNTAYYAGDIYRAAKGPFNEF